MKAQLTVLGLSLVLSTASLFADTLVFTNGRRMQGELVGVYGREVEFEEREGGRRRTVRIPRNDIDRIEFNDRDSFFDRDRDRDRDRDDRVEGQVPGPVAIPRGMRERVVNVDSRVQWTDSGIDLRPGQPIYFGASGEVRWGPNRRDGAEGERNSPRNNGRPLPDRPAAALIGRIGNGTDYFFIGAEPGPYRARGGGRLYLGINDDFLADNSGVLRVTVSY
ncbi:MAG TPA: hypothetical protein VGF24_22160 [Vicinamibacterales bacterium]